MSHMENMKFPDDYLRAYCERFDVAADLVKHDGREFRTHMINSNTGKTNNSYYYNYNYVTPLECIKAEFPIHSKTLNESYGFTCSKGVRWIVNPL